MNTKICSICKIEKPLNEFYKHETKDGFRNDCKKCRKSKVRSYYYKNKEQIYIKNKNYRQQPGFKDRRKAWDKKYLSSPKGKTKRQLYYSTFENRIIKNLRTRIWKIFKGISKQYHSLQLLGCSPEFFKSYIVSKFQPGMTIENYGLWEIDHIRPCVSFNLKLESEQKACCHYTNLQPLWKHDNCSKGSKI